MKIANPSLWWPWTMSSNPGQMYPFQVKEFTGTLSVIFLG